MFPKIVFTREELNMLLTVAERERCTPGDALRRILICEFYRGAPRQKSPQLPQEREQAREGVSNVN